MAVRPNMLVILTSGQRGDALSAAGNWPIDTPHFDAMASSGLALTAISPSPAPLPAMVSMYTGLHPRQHGVLDDSQPAPRLTGWLASLREAGYYTAGVGRVAAVADHLNDKRIVAGPTVTDVNACEYLRHAVSAGLIEAVAHQRRVARQTALFDPADGIREPADDVDGFITDTAVKMVANLPTGRPWCLVVAYTGPGNRLPAPPMYLDCIEAASLTEDFVPAAVGSLDDFGQFDVPRTVLQQLGPKQAARIRQHYFARNALIDCGVGMLRDAIDHGGLARSAWTVLSSDRGELLGERGAFAGTAFIGSASYVPLWVVPPAGHPLNTADVNDDQVRSADGLISSTCLAATLCDLAGADLPTGCGGESVLPALGGGRLGRDLVISEFADRLLAETLQYKAMFDVPTGKLRVLFDMVADPHERTNLADAADADEVIDMLHRRLTPHLMRLRPAGP